MITLKFALQAKLSEVKTVELASYKEFFDFYIKNNDKGIIFDVKKLTSLNVESK